MNGEQEQSSAEDFENISESGVPSDRRGGLRHLACFPAYLETTEGVPRSALIRDLSVSGALLLTRARLKVGDEVKLSLYFGEDEEPFAAAGRVVREEKRTGELSHPWTKSVAIKFDEDLTSIEPQIRELAAKQAALFGRKATK